ncbi:MoaD/ThiS family protein [Arenimonas donghaensis]|nr:MoaD/ThiS family protein [Arenimonas donghaensis]
MPARSRVRMQTMARVVVAPALSRRLPGQGDDRELALDLPGDTVADVLGALFARHPPLRGYVLDEQGAPRRHIALFIDGDALQPKNELSRPVSPGAEIYVMQALSGG